MNKNHKKGKKGVGENEAAEPWVPSLGATFSRVLIEELSDFDRLWETGNILSIFGNSSSKNDEGNPEAFPQYVIRPFSSATTRSATKIACKNVQPLSNKQVVSDNYSHH